MKSKLTFRKIRSNVFCTSSASNKMSVWERRLKWRLTDFSIWLTTRAIQSSPKFAGKISYTFSLLAQWTPKSVFKLSEGKTVQTMTTIVFCRSKCVLTLSGKFPGTLLGRIVPILPGIVFGVVIFSSWKVFGTLKENLQTFNCFITSSVFIAFYNTTR